MRTCQVLLIGPPHAGKTTLLRRCVDGTPGSQQYAPTHFPDVRQRIVDGMRLSVWDVPASVIGDLAAGSSLRRVLATADACLMLFDMSSRASFQQLADYVRLRPQLGPTCRCCVIVGNKSDAARIEVPEREIEAYATSRGMLYATISARHNWCVDALLSMVVAVCAATPAAQRLPRTRSCSCAVL